MGRQIQPHSPVLPIYHPSTSIQANGEANSDVVISFSTATGAATYYKDTYPAEIIINPTWFASLTDDERAAIIAHEIAHPYGLANAYFASTGCDKANTIMNGLNPTTNKPVYKDVQDRDVYQMNKFWNDKTKCCTDWNAGGSIEQGHICSDNDNDGVTDCNGDCDDSDPYVISCPSDPCSYQFELACQDKGPEYVWENCTCSYRSGECAGGYNPICTPIVVDTLGNGFNLTDAQGGVGFDLNGNGIIQGRLSWTSASSDDAWLALDRNGNGTIDNGQELFGNFTPQPESDTPNGFLALAEYDKTQNGGNGDDLIDKADAIFNSLRLWQDMNHNGISEAGELHTLKQVGLTSIDLDYRESRRRDQYGNWFRYRAKVKDNQGNQLGRWAWDVNLFTGP